MEQQLVSTNPWGVGRVGHFLSILVNSWRRQLKVPSTYLIRSYPNSSEINLGHHEGKFEDASMRGSSATTLKEIIFAPWMEDTVGSNFSHWKKKKDTTRKSFILWYGSFYMQKWSCVTCWLHIYLHIMEALIRQVNCAWIIIQLYLNHI